MAGDAPTVQVIVIDGEEFNDRKLTIREKRTMRQMLINDLGLTWEQASDPPLEDYIAVLATVIRRRTDPDYKLEQAFEMTEDDYLRERAATDPPITARAKK